MTCIALVACAKRKLSGAAAAQDLYVSPLFAKCRKLAEANCDRWFILSAKHGLLPPDHVIDPYEMTLNKLSKALLAEWADRVFADLEPLVGSNDEVTILAGQRYRDRLVPRLESIGCRVIVPLLGLSIGAQLKRLNEMIAVT